MKSNTKVLMLFLLIVVLLMGCTDIEDVISKEEAKQLVIEKRTTENTDGRVEIISIEIKSNSYYVEWENKENTEWGIDRVTKDGEVKMVEATIE
ncbi:MAG TPA: hypothetical protein VJ962_12755 [Clostridia bacterium]|nr:hypothetical protein [Clostridia bacterium]